MKIDAKIEEVHEETPSRNIEVDAMTGTMAVEVRNGILSELKKPGKKCRRCREEAQANINREHYD